MYYYADTKTRKFLESDKSRVYIFGSCGGYNNFGDVIQLKNAIDFHRKRTKLEPVVVMFLGSLEGSYHPEAFKRWYDVAHFIFLSPELLDASDAHLAPVEKIRSGFPLHVYGGGFLNKFWGKDMIEAIRSMVVDFKVSKYAFSGQQIDPEITKDLKKLFTIKAPERFGLRDRASLSYMEKDIPKVKSVFSFDDVTEIFEQWSKRKLSSKQRLRNKLATPSVLWHINISSYVTDNKSALRDKMVEVQRRHPRYSLTVAHAYNDRRRGLFDSLQSIVEFENDFPYSVYKVINIAQMAMELQPHKDLYANLAGLIGNVKFAVTSSYHTAMLMNYFGIPAYLMSANDYYAQKQKGLGYETNFEKFLANPQVNLRDFAEERRERVVWLDDLAGVYKDAIDAKRSVNGLDVPKRKKLTPLAYRSY